MRLRLRISAIWGGKTLDRHQSGWIKSLLTVWGDTMRGEAAPRCQEAMNAGELLEEIAGLINLLSALLRQLSRRGRKVIAVSMR
jgi:hypothetical protein